ncbi:MAG: 50S ribosomal protein L25 [Patescibacteria group bacterium]|jgi:large subunit ribosomal protein L25
MELIAEKREILGKGSKKLRAQRKIPAVMFAKDIDSVPITLGAHDFEKVFSEAGETSLIDLKIDGKKESVLVREVQYHPVSDQVIHISFFKVDLKEKISAEIPVEIVGEQSNELVKSGEALVLTLLNEITVEALPMDLPSEFTVDISNITEIGTGVTVGQLSYDRSKVEIMGLEADEMVVRLDVAEMAEVEEPEVSEEELVEGIEATKETAAEEGEEGAEGSDSSSKESKKDQE